MASLESFVSRAKRRVEKSLRAIADVSHERVDAVFNEASSLYPVDMVTERLIEPVLIALGENWRNRPSDIAEEHFYAAWVRNRPGSHIAVTLQVLASRIPVHGGNDPRRRFGHAV